MSDEQQIPEDPHLEFSRWVDQTLTCLEVLTDALTVDDALSYARPDTVAAIAQLIELVPQGVAELVGVAQWLETERATALEQQRAEADGVQPVRNKLVVVQG